MKASTIRAICFLTACALLLTALLSGCGVKSGSSGKATDIPEETVTEVPVHAHTFGEWNITKEPTCTEPGEWERSCPCGQVEREVLPARGHDFVDRVCTRCGEKLPGDGTGLEYTEAEDGSGYILTGAGTCTDTILVVPGTYEGKPVVAVGDEAFNENTYITEVVLQEGIQKIGKKAFRKCTALRSIVLPEGLTEIDISAFNSCTALASVKLPESLKSLGEWAFCRCESLKEFELSKGVEKLDYGCIARLGGLEKLTVQEGNPKYHSAGNCVIETEAKVLAFGCRTSVIPDDGSVTELGTYSFYYIDSFTELVIPGTIVKIGSEAFEGCKSLVSVTLSEGVKVLGFAAFRNCSELTKVIIPDTVEEIERSVFSDCTKLTEINLGNGLKSIDKYVFSGSGITKLTLPKSLVDIQPCAFGAGFNALEELVVEEGNPRYHSAGNCIIETATKTLVAGCKTSVIPDDGSVTVIGTEAFYGCSALPEITIPEGVTTIEEEAYYHCIGATVVNLPASLTTVVIRAFASCENITTVNYAGTPEQWKTVKIEQYNDWLKNAYKG